MNITSEGIVLKQVKATGGRRMIVLFTKTYGKISAGTGINERSKGKSSLAIRPFTYGKYDLYKNKEFYNINGAETVKSFYKIGENIDRYLSAAYVLELTDRILEENIAQPKIFMLLKDFLYEIEIRNKKYETLVISYIMKILGETGYMPSLDSCVKCGRKEHLDYFSIRDGGALCDLCASEIFNSGSDSLIYEAGLSIINIMKYLEEKPFITFRNIALEDDKKKVILDILHRFIKYHLDIGEIKSEDFLFKKNRI